MRRSMTIGVVAVVLAFGPDGMAASNEFEGVVHVKSVADGQPSTQQWFFKGERLRMEDTAETGERTVMVFDGQNHRSFIIDMAKKTYLEIPVQVKGDEYQEVMKDIEVRATGRSENIAGHLCELWVSRDKTDGSTSEMCMAKGLGNSAMLGLTKQEAGSHSGLPPWMRDLMKDGGFPLRGIDRDGEGKEESRWEATKIEDKSMEEDLFSPPPGFQRLNIGDMGKELAHGAERGARMEQPQKEKRVDTDQLMKQLDDIMEQAPSKGTQESP